MSKRMIIHVNRHLIAQNAKDGGHRPIYSVKEGRRTTYAHGVEISGRVTLIDPRSTPPLPCGARAYLSVDGDVTLIDPCAFEDARGAAA